MKSKWNDRLHQFEVPPPEKGWDEISASLDESFTGHQFPLNLYNAEANPPPGAWKNIQDSLSGDITPAIPIRQAGTRSLFIRYAIAACLTGLIAFAAIKFFTAGNPEKGLAVKQATKPVNDSSGDAEKSNSVSPVPATTADTEKDDQALEESKHTYAKLGLPAHSLSTRISASLYSAPAQLSSSLSAENGLEKSPEIQYPHRAAVNDMPGDRDENRYLMFKDSEGRFIKISKKLTSLFCCVSGEEHTDDCDDQLKKWREKIASSSFIPSPDNFMDILDLVSSLQDTRN